MTIEIMNIATIRISNEINSCSDILIEHNTSLSHLCTIHPKICVIDSRKVKIKVLRRVEESATVKAKKTSDN